jgi:hypothetical protein
VVLHDVEAWFSSNGIKIRCTRFDLILNNFQQMVRTSADDYIKKRGFEDYFYTALGAIAFVDIYRGFSTYSGSLPKKKIEESLSGPLIPREEILGDKNVNPRNTFFELEIASRLMRSGFKVTGFNDINLKFEQYRFVVECKRLLSKSNIEYNIKYAYAQLSKKLLNVNDRGIIALTFDRSYSLNDKLLESGNTKDINAKLNQIGDIFIRDNAHVWNNFLNLRVIGIILFINFGAVYQDSKVLYSQQTCLIALRSDIQVADKELLLRFGNMINDSYNK